jgi:hypothetical protein
LKGIRHSGEGRARIEALSSLFNILWMPDQVRHDASVTFYAFLILFNSQKERTFSSRTNKQHLYINFDWIIQSRQKFQQGA